MWLDFFDHGKKVVVLLALPIFVVASEWALANRKVLALGFE